MPFVADKKTIGGFASNVLSSSANLVGSTAGAILNPFETVKNIISLAKDPQVVVDYYKKRYGKDLLETLYTDPASVAADLSVLTGGISGLAKAGGLSKVANVAGTISKFSDPLQLAGMGASKVLKPVTSKISSIGENMAFSGLHDPKIQKNIKGITGKTPFELSQEYSTWSRKPSDVQKAISNIDEYVKLKLKGKSVDVRDIMKDLDGAISKLEGDISDSAQIQKEYLIRKKAEIANSLVKNGSVMLDQPAEIIVSLKRQVGADVPKTQWNIGAAESAKGEAAKSAYNVFKNRIIKIDKTLKQKGLDESGLIRMKKLFENEANRAGARNTIGLSDLVVGGSAFTAGGFLPAAATVLAKKALETPKAVEVGSKVFSRIGKLEVPQPLKKGANLLYQPGKSLRMINAPSKEKQGLSQPKLPMVEKRSSLPQAEQPVKSYSDYTTPQFTSSLSYKSPKLKSNVFGGRKLTRSSAY